MIEAIRRYSSSWVVKGLFLVLVLSFVLWGVADVFRPGARQEWAAEVDGATIPLQTFAQEYQLQARRIRSEAGSPISAEDLQRGGLPQMVIERMIHTQLLDAAAARLKVTVSSERVTRTIAGDPRFHNQAGQFDPHVFRLALRAAGLSEGQYLALQHGDLRRAQILASIGGSITVPPAFAEVIGRYFFEQRRGQFVTVPLPPVEEIGTPDRLQLEAFHRENPGLFTAPEYRAITAIVLDAAEMAKGIAISQQDLEQAYAERLDEFVEPERRSFQQMIFSDAGAAREAERRLLAGEDFNAVGEAMLGQRPDALVVRDVTRDVLPAALAGAVFTQPAGVVSGPVETPLGWHLVKVTAVTTATQRTLDQVRDDLAARLRLERATESLVDTGNRLDDALGRGLKLEEAASELGLAVRHFPAIDPDGRDPDGKPVAGAFRALVERAFTTPRGEESVLAEGDDNTLFVLRVDDVTPAQVKPFDTVQAAVADAWRANRRIELARQRAEGLAARVRSEADLASVAAAEKLSVVSTPALSRATMRARAEVPRPVAEAMFQTAKGASFVARSADAFYVGRVADVVAPSAAVLEGEGRGLREELGRAIASDVSQQFLAALRGEHSVKVNTAALERAL